MRIQLVQSILEKNLAARTGVDTKDGLPENNPRSLLRVKYTIYDTWGKSGFATDGRLVVVSCWLLVVG